MTMAGLQSCLRNAFILKNVHIVKSAHSLDLVVRRKHLAFAASALRTSHFLRKGKITSNFNWSSAIRFSSTDIAGSNATIINLSDEVKNEPNPLPDNVTPPPNASLDSTTNAATGATINTVNDAASDAATHDIAQVFQNAEIVIDESLLPPPPSIPVDETLTSAVEIISSTLKEPTFESLGLNSYWPTGWIHRALEYLHITCDLPWWASIAIVTVCLRMLIFPINIKARKNSINMNNHMPQIQLFQMKINEAKRMGNYYDTSLYLQQLQTYMTKNNILTFTAILPMLAQAPIFLSMFWGLRSMANLPVESMKTGGCLWFQDLTVVDPYYALPLLIAGTMFIIIETGAEGTSVSSLTNIWMKYGMRAMPFIILPFTINFPAAVQCYWAVSNCVSLCQVLLFKIPPVRNFLGIPVAIKHDPKEFAAVMPKTKGISGFRESYENMKLINEVMDRQRLNTVTFEKAGSGPIPRTFKKDPTKFKK